MLKEFKNKSLSLGTEPIEELGFESEEELDEALIPLMCEAKKPHSFWFHM